MYSGYSMLQCSTVQYRLVIVSTEGRGNIDPGPAVMHCTHCTPLQMFTVLDLRDNLQNFTKGNVFSLIGVTMLCMQGGEPLF